MGEVALRATSGVVCGDREKWTLFAVEVDETEVSVADGNNNDDGISFPERVVPVCLLGGENDKDNGGIEGNAQPWTKRRT